MFLLICIIAITAIWDYYLYRELCKVRSHKKKFDKKKIK